jgi:hypothetical protein
MKTTLLSVLIGLAITYSYGQWTFSSLSVPTDYMGASVLGSKAYFAGGEDCVNLVSKVEIYDTKTGIWTYDNLSVARELPFATTCGSKIFFAGGVDFYISQAVFSTIDIYDTIDQTWDVKQLSIPRLQAAVVSHGNKVLFAGGTNYQTGACYDVVDIYNVETGDWSTASLSIPRVVWWAKVGDLAIFAGDYSNQQSSKRVDIYNFTTDSWSIDSLSVPRAFIGMTTIGNKVLIAGGMVSGNTPSNIVDIYDASTGSWSTANLSLARAFADNQQAVTACGKAYFVGGGKIHLNQGYWTAAYTVIDIYDDATGTWSVDTMPLSKRVHHAVVAIDNKVIIAGGYLMDPPYGCDDAVAIYTCPSTNCLPEGITFTTQQQIDNFQTNYPECSEIEGNVTIFMSNITNLNGLSVLNTIGGNLSISSNPSLVSLSGLGGLTSIGGSFYLDNNNSLINFEGLENLNSVSGDFDIGYIESGNSSLTSLNGLNNLDSIGGRLWITSNPQLTNLTGLENLTDLGGDLWIEGNYSLSSLQGLDNINAFTISNLFIFSNSNLYNCDIQSICEYLASPNGTITIEDNNSGCNSPEEVETACLTTVEEIKTGNGIIIIPNPSNDKITVSIPNGVTIVEVVIYNQTGQKVLQEKLVKNTLDISKLQKGIYIIELRSNENTIMKKLVIE